MPMTEPWPVLVIPVGPVAAGSVLWRRAGQLHATIVAKITFPWAPGGVLLPGDPAEVYRAERHTGDNPARSIIAASDLCPFLELADVLFIGNACAPGGEPASVVKVKVALVRGSWFLVDKEILVYGDRSSFGAEPKPFQRMPIVYEKAFGGAGNLDNPLGIPTPNVVYEDPERLRAPASLGPISWYWPSRKKTLKPIARSILDRGTPEIPEDLDPECFQAAPEDQRVPLIRGEDLILLRGVHPDHPEIMMRLPAFRGQGRIYTKGGGGAMIPLKPDTLLIDGYSETCSITLRGSFPVQGEEALEGLCVAAAVEIGGNPIEWPDEIAAHLLTERPRGAAAVSAAAAERGWNERTVELRSQNTVAMRPATPFAAANARIAAALRPEHDPLFDGTGTLAIEASKPAKKVAPFAIPAPGSSPSAAGPVPGAPWDPKKEGVEPAPRIVMSFPDEPTVDTMELKLPTLPETPGRLLAPSAPADVAAPAPPPAPASVSVSESAPAAVPAAAPAPAEKPAEKPSWSWAPQQSPPPEKPAAPPKPPPAPAVKNKLYGSFGTPKK